MASDILVKGMVCERCVSVITDGLNNLGHEVNKISLGRLSVKTDLSKDDHLHIETFLNENGFEIISNRKLRIVKEVKELINEAFSGGAKHDLKQKFSTLLTENLHMNYDSISVLFHEIEGTTIEKYIITKRLEKVKELLLYTELTLTEIAYITGFSSINHLSRQFKELSGLTPSQFKSVQSKKFKLSGAVQSY